MSGCPKHVLYADNVAINNVRIIHGVHTLEDAAALAPLQPTSILFSGGRVHSVGHSTAPESVTTLDGSDLYLIPGLIDLQLNDMAWLDKGGGVGVCQEDLTWRLNSLQMHTEEENIDRLLLVAMRMWEEGCTSYILTSLASPWEELIAYLKGINAFRRHPFSVQFSNCKDPLQWSFAGNLLGATVEGTFMNKRFRGCHNDAYVHDLIPGKWEGQLKEIMETGSIFAVNVAPETNVAEALRFIDQAKNRYGAVVAIGHCQPTGAQLRNAIAHGVEYVIHLGNGATGFSWKKFHGGGMLEECLLNDNMHVTIIGDGFHVSKRYLRDWILRKELHRCTLVTDRAFATGSPDNFTVFGITGRREDTPKGSFLRVWKAGDPPVSDLLTSSTSTPFTLFGSHASMLQTFENAVNWFSKTITGVSTRLHPAFSLEQALAVSVSLCSTNPAKLAKRKDLGRLDAGFVGNAVLVKVVQLPNGRKVVQVVKVIVGV